MSEQRILDTEIKSREKLNREADQRYLLRWGAVLVAIFLDFFMGWALYHSSHAILSPNYFEAPSSYIVAAYVAPIASMTAITIALLVAAFRGFKEEDEKNTASTMVHGARASGVAGGDSGSV